jgi:hypothetical protein
MRKGENITVYNDTEQGRGRGVQCSIVDVDHAARKVWVRFPTNQVLEMTWHARRNMYTGRMARLEFTADSSQ